MASCSSAIVSQNFADYIVEYGGIGENIYSLYQTDCVQIFNERYAAFHLPVASMDVAVNLLAYSAIPKLFGLMDTSSMDSSGITRLQQQTYLDLKGQDIIIGIIDTGIDYTHPAFRRSDGGTRILRLWDQSGLSQTDGEPSFPAVDYGAAYTGADIDRALESPDPGQIVPLNDVDGHGTFIAGIAAGSEDEAGDFTGAAPRSQIAVVKLKPAKRYLRDFYQIREGVPAYQENDIMAGVAYLIRLSQTEKKPISICIGLGTNSGDHSGGSYLSRYLNMAGSLAGTCVTCAAGNEGSRAGHFLGIVEENAPYTEVELRVGSDERGFVTELWAQAPDIYSVGFVSPGGEVVERLDLGLGESRRIQLLLEPTAIYINSRISEAASGSQVIFIRFEKPVPGIWRIRVYGSNLLYKRFHMWLPIHDFIREETMFLTPWPDNTVTAPADSWGSLAVGAYDHYNNSVYLYTSRGFTPSGMVVPDFCAPGVNVFGAGRNGRYTAKSGTSVAAAHVCGAAALLLQWGIYGRGEYTMSTLQVRQYLIRGARRQDNTTYPSTVWGYGTLDVYRAFEIFIQ